VLHAAARPLGDGTAFVHQTPAARIEVGDDGADSLEAVQDVDLHALEIALEAAEAEPTLLTGRLGVHDLPREPACLDLGAWKERAHTPTPCAPCCGSTHVCCTK